MVMRSNSRRTARSRTLFCSFCGKSEQDVRKLVAGPTVFICNECVTEAQRVLAEGDIKAAIKPRIVT